MSNMCCIRAAFTWFDVVQLWELLPIITHVVVHLDQTVQLAVNSLIRLVLILYLGMLQVSLAVTQETT